MENEDYIIDGNFAEAGLALNSQGRRELKSAGIWGLIMSIFGFLSAGIMSLSGFSILAVFNSGMPGMDQPGMEAMNGMGILIIVLGLIFMLPVVYLLRFSIKAMKAESKIDTYDLGLTISLLKKSFMSYAIIVLVSFIFYIIWIVYLGVSVGSM